MYDSLRSYPDRLTKKGANLSAYNSAASAAVVVPGLGQVRYDIAFGGAFYAYVQAAEVGLTCTPEDFGALIERGMAIKRAVMTSRPIPHPFEEDLSFLYGTIFIRPPRGVGAHSRNVCIFAEGEVDRCPTGTGVSGRLAIHHARGEIGLSQPIVVESIIGSRFTGRIVETTTFGPYPAVIPEVEGTAYITGRHEFLIDPADPLREGFILR
jgi:proline racemase